MASQLPDRKIPDLESGVSGTEDVKPAELHPIAADKAEAKLADLEANKLGDPESDVAGKEEKKEVDLESGVLPGKVGVKLAAELDAPLRWAFVRKVYCILALQFAFTAAVAAVACFVKPIPRFFMSNTLAAWGSYLAILFSPFPVMWPLYKYREKHPVNLIVLGIFTVCISLSVAIASSTAGGKAVLQAAILAAVAVFGLTLFTFLAARRGCDFNFLFPFLFVSLIVLMFYLLMQICHPLGKVGTTVYGFLATLVFSGFIIYDTERLIKHHPYNEYVHAAITLYLDVINLFMAQLTLTIGN